MELNKSEIIRDIELLLKEKNSRFQFFITESVAKEIVKSMYESKDEVEVYQIADFLCDFELLITEKNLDFTSTYTLNEFHRLASTYLIEIPKFRSGTVEYLLCYFLVASEYESFKLQCEINHKEFKYVSSPDHQIKSFLKDMLKSILKNSFRATLLVVTTSCFFHAIKYQEPAPLFLGSFILVFLFDSIKAIFIKNDSSKRSLNRSIEAISNLRHTLYYLKHGVVAPSYLTGLAKRFASEDLSWFDPYLTAICERAINEKRLIIKAQTVGPIPNRVLP